MTFSELLLILLPALIQVESSGNNLAIGDNGKAHGCLQIHKILVRDVNSIYKTKFTYNDRFNRTKSLAMAHLYLLHYAKQYSKKTGKVPNIEVLARIWNGGPNGYKKQDTKKYWLKVKAQILLNNKKQEPVK